MTQEEKQEIALMRYSAIAPLVAGLDDSFPSQSAFFEAVFAKVGQPSEKRMVLLGDSLTSDMTGGKQAGMDTCWFAPAHLPDPIGCTWRISRLLDFLPIVLETDRQNS